MSNPLLFISHGAPNTIIKDTKTKINLREISNHLGDFKYIVVVSAHWVSRGLKIISPFANELIYDFYGFEEELYKIKYPIKSDEKYTQELISLLKDFNPKIDLERNGYDHGVWAPLKMIYDEIEVPVIQLSLPIDYNSEQLVNLGEKLHEIRDDALIICSGSITHNLRDISYNMFEKPKKSALDFNLEMKKLIERGDISKIKEYQNINGFRQNHPSVEHFTPILIALGASGDDKGKSFNSEFLYSCISMESYIFKG